MASADIATPVAPGPVIRTATNDDVPAVRAVIAAAYAEYTTVIPSALYEPYLAELLDLDARRGGNRTDRGRGAR